MPFTAAANRQRASNALTALLRFQCNLNTCKVTSYARHIKMEVSMRTSDGKQEVLNLQMLLIFDFLKSFGLFKYQFVTFLFVKLFWKQTSVFSSWQP